MTSFKTEYINFLEELIRTSATIKREGNHLYWCWKNDRQLVSQLLLNNLAKKSPGSQSFFETIHHFITTTVDKRESNYLNFSTTSYCLPYVICIKPNQDVYELTGYKSNGNLITNQDEVIEQDFLKVFKRNKSALKSANIGVWELDIDRGIIYLDDTSLAICGFANEAVIDSLPLFTSCVCADDLEPFNQHLDACKNQNKDFKIGFKVKYCENETKYIEINSQFLTDVEQDKNVNKFIGTLAYSSAERVGEYQHEYLAYHDELTGLANRTLVFDRLRQSIESCKRAGYFHSLMFIDVDDFKIINDSLGHDVGDIVLKTIAERLKVSVRGVDTVARLGGDEFCVILTTSNKSLEESSVIAQKSITNIQKIVQRSINVGSHKIVPSISAGITIYDGENSVSTKSLMQEADIAMYEAKEAGKGTYHFFNEIMREKLLIRINLEKELKKALDENEFELYFQPQYSLKSTLLGAEALVRWNHPEKGLVFPGEFIGILESSSMIHQFGYWAIEECCKKIQKWGEFQHFKNCSLSVNISSLQFSEPNFVENIKDIFDRTEVKANKLVFEITESLFFEHHNKTIDVLISLGQLGVQFSVDDFGTGYSSPSYLKKLPIHEIKIDQSFVKNIENELADEMIVRTIVNLATNFELQVIAEGVETKEHLEKLKELNCRRYQGYYFSKPLPEDEFIKHIESCSEQSQNNLDNFFNDEFFTGVTSRRNIFSQLEHWITQSPLERFGVILIEAHYFKSINNAYGIQIGDKLINSIAKRIEKSSPVGSLDGKMGGDGFAVLLQPDYSKSSKIFDIASGYLGILRRAFSIEGNIILLDASISMSSYPEHGKTALDVIQYADIALNSQSAIRAENIEKFSNESVNNIRQHHKLTNDFRASLTSELPYLHLGEQCGSFELLYQPIVASGSNKVVAAELQVSWKNSAYANLAHEKVSEFKVKIQNDPILKLWLFKRAQSDFSPSQIKTLNVNVPISTKLLAQESNFVNDLKRLKTINELEANRITLIFDLEEDLPPFLETIMSLKQEGFNLALINFKADIASFDITRKLPLSYVKLDASVVSELMQQKNKKRFECLFSSLFSEIDTKVIANRINTKQQAEYAKSLGICESYSQENITPLIFKDFVNFCNSSYSEGSNQYE